MSELRKACNNAIDETKLTDDKLVLTIFCFGVCASFRLLQQQTIQEFLPIILHANYMLQSRETGELYAIATTALIFCIGFGYVDASVLNQLCSSEVVEVQQRACEAYVLI